MLSIPLHQGAALCSTFPAGCSWLGGITRLWDLAVNWGQSPLPQQGFSDGKTPQAAPNGGGGDCALHCIGMQMLELLLAAASLGPPGHVPRGLPWVPSAPGEPSCVDDQDSPPVDWKARGLYDEPASPIPP